MKIILSRKGFDSASGKVPSPILPSGQLCSLPIPDAYPAQQITLRSYQEIQAGDVSVGQLVDDLTRGRIPPAQPTHLDPDLNAASVPRLPGGLSSASQAQPRPIYGDKASVLATSSCFMVGFGRWNWQTAVSATFPTPPTGTFCSAGCKLSGASP